MGGAEAIGGMRVVLGFHLFSEARPQHSRRCVILADCHFEGLTSLRSGLMWHGFSAQVYLPGLQFYASPRAEQLFLAGPVAILASGHAASQTVKKVPGRFYGVRVPMTHPQA